MARTDGDTWDLASSVGATATAVAASRAMASRDPTRCSTTRSPNRWCGPSGIDTSSSGSSTASYRSTTIRCSTADAMSEQIAVRTRFFDDFFTDATRCRHPAGRHPGLRPRHPRLPADWPAGHRGVRDRPARGDRVQDPDAGRPRAPRRRPNAAPSRIDLRDDWPAALRAAGFDPTQPTAWIAEGLLVYLPPDAQDRLFDNITALSRAGQPAGHRAHGHQRRCRRLGARSSTERSRRHRLRHQPGRTVLLRRAQHRAATIWRRMAGRSTCVRPRTPSPPTVSSCPTTNWRRSAGDSGYLTAVLG